jgi:hypothetical protein
VRVPEYPKQMLRLKSDDDRAAFVLAANLFRRHLAREQRAEVVTRLRAKGWSLRRIGEAFGVEEITVRRDLEGATFIAPERIEGADRKAYPARRPRSTIFVSSPRDAARAAKALQALGDDARSWPPG